MNLFRDDNITNSYQMKIHKRKNKFDYKIQVSSLKIMRVYDNQKQ